jgi:hypothetical protein
MATVMISMSLLMICDISASANMLPESIVGIITEKSWDAWCDG